MNSEQELIEKCIENNRIAQKNLYDKYCSKLYVICLRYSHTKEEAEDILSEGFINIFTNLRSYKNEGSFEGWLCKIMVNTAISYIRTHSKHYFADDITEFNNMKDANIDYQIDRIDEKQLIKIIQKMPESYKIIFNLAIVEGHTHKEIAEILDINIGTSKSQLNKSKKWLKEKLETELVYEF